MKIFISYAHVDKTVVQDVIVDILRNARHDVWIDDRLSVGHNWQQELADEIANADAVVFAVSPDAVSSEYCQWEIDRAISLKKPIVPVLIREGATLPRKLQEIQYVDFSNGATGTGVAQLLAGIEKHNRKPRGMMPLIVTIIILAVVIVPVILVVSNNASSAASAPPLVPSDTPTMTLSPTDTLTPTDEATNTPINTPATPIVRADEETSIRRGPSAGFEIMLAWDGRPLDILGISEDGLWYQVLLRDGRRGWVLTSQNVVDVDGNQEIIPVIEVTNTPVPPTSTPTDTDTPTITPSDTPTLTITPSPTYTPSPTDTPTPSHTPRIPPTARPTNTPIPTATSSQCLGVIPGVGSMINQVKRLPNPGAPNQTPIQRGTTVVILDVTSDFGTTWYRIEYDDTSGWIPEDYVDVPSNCP